MAATLLISLVCVGCANTGSKPRITLQPVYGTDTFAVPAGSRIIGPDGEPVQWVNESGAIVSTTATNGQWISGRYLRLAYDAVMIE